MFNSKTERREEKKNKSSQTKDSTNFNNNKKKMKYDICVKTDEFLIVNKKNII